MGGFGPFRGSRESAGPFRLRRPYRLQTRTAAPTHTRHTGAGRYDDTEREKRDWPQHALRIKKAPEVIGLPGLSLWSGTSDQNAAVSEIMIAESVILRIDGSPLFTSVST